MYTNTGCKRLIDYYFVVSCSEHGKEQTKRRLKSSSLAPTSHEKRARHAMFALKPKVVDRYPQHNYINTPLLQWVARASMPRGVRACTKPPQPKYFTFTGWNTDGSKLYGACLEVFEKIEIKNQKQDVFIPKTLGFLSHYPYFYSFDVLLRCLWHVIPKELIRLEDLLMHYFYDIPAPAPKKKMAYDMGRMKLLLACRNEFDIPIMELPNETSFTQLSKDRICMLLKLLLLESRVIVVCANIHQFTPVCELFGSLLFPLRWQHLFIPLMCRSMALGLKDYDGPFFLGIPRFTYMRPEIRDNLPDDTVLVFLDRNEICDTSKKPIPIGSLPPLPQPLEEELKDCIHALAWILTMNEGSVGRNDILQAYRAMFSLVRKILFHAHNVKPGSQTNEFLRQFRETLLYKSFVRYYQRLNPKDTNLSQIYTYFKANEALGKHFARQNNTRAWGSTFDKSLYKEGALRINQDIIRKSEKQYAKKRADFSASTHGRTYALPPEFEWTDSTREFYSEHIFSQDSKPTQKPKPTKTNVKQIIKALKQKPLGKWAAILAQCHKLETAITDSDVNFVAEAIKKDKHLREIGTALQKELTTKQQSTLKRVLKAVEIALAKKKPKQPTPEPIRKKPKVEPEPEPVPIKPEPEPKPEPKLEPKPKPEPEPKPEPTVDDPKTPKKETTPDISDFVEPVTTIKPVESVPRKSGMILILEDDKSSTAVREAIQEVIPIPSPIPDDSPPTKPPTESESSEEETSSEETTSDEGSSDWDDSEDEFFAASDDDMKADDFERRDSTASVIRTTKRFRNLNEFELKPEEKKWFRHCERTHNQLFVNGLHIQIQSATDLFDDKLLGVWAAYDKKVKRKKSLYKKQS